MWRRAGELVAVDLDGTKAWALAEDESALLDDTDVAGVRLLANLDPLNAAGDRELLVPDPAVRTRIFRAIGGPGIMLVDGDVGGLWRAAKKGKQLLITVELLRDLGAAAKDELAAEAERLAPFRGADAGRLRMATL